MASHAEDALLQHSGITKQPRHFIGHGHEGAALFFALAGSALLMLIGGWLFDKLFDGRAVIDQADLGLTALALVALSVICVSVYVQAAFGRFAHLLQRSLPFLAGSLLSVPLAGAFWPDRFDLGFLGLYALTLMLAAGLHLVSLRRLVRA